MPQPWLHPAVTNYLASLLYSTDTVIEHGSGGSTLWLAERVKRVISTEHDRAFFFILKGLIPANVEYHYLITQTVPDSLPASNLLLIDGEPVETRAEWLKQAPALVKPGGIIVLDNANRPEYRLEYAALKEKAQQCITFDMNARGTKYLVTSFFLMPGGEREWI
jgi:predicted O-methyltransferase YrrM